MQREMEHTKTYNTFTSVFRFLAGHVTFLFDIHMKCPHLGKNEIMYWTNFQRFGIKHWLETFMAVVQRTGAGSNPRISCVVSKSDSDHGTATTATEPLG